MDEGTEKKKPANPDRGASALPFSEDLFRLLFEEVPCYGCILDPALNIVAVNRRCRETFTTPFSRRCFQVFKGREKVCGDCPAVRTLEGGVVSESREVVRDRAGRDLHVICRTMPVRNGDGRVTGVIHMSVHAGEGQRLQQEMTAFDSQLGAVSHGIKGLLTAMAGGFYLWDTGIQKNKPERLGEGYTIVRRNFYRLQHLARDVLYYVRDRSLHLEPLDGVELLRKLAGDLNEDGDFSNARIRLAESLPFRITLEADRRALTSILANLVVSSLDDCYTDERDVEHEVVLSVKEQEGFALFEVEDNGVGMDRETLEKVFSLFFNPKGIEAAGVGLYITNKLARAHAGSVDIRSEPGRGTCYSLRIPLKPPA